MVARPCPFGWVRAARPRVRRDLLKGTKGSVKRPLFLLLAPAAAVLSVGAATAAKPARPASIACGKTRTIAVMAPLSGTLGYLGREQRNWARLAVLRANARSGRRFRLVEADTRLDSDTAAARAQQLAANARVLGVVGPAGSDEVEAVAPAFARAKLAYVSGSAYRASLTAGARPGFFRVIPSDASQAPTAAAYMLSVLRVKHVLVVDDRSAYSIPLADTVQRLLRAGGANVRRDSVGQTQVDFSPVISKVNRNTDAVLLPWQNPAKAQLFGVELRGRGKAATVFGTDGLFSTDFTLAGSYVTVFAPDP